MGIYVGSSRPDRDGAPNKWTVLYSPNGTPPTDTPLDPNYLPSSLINSITDPLVIVVHGYNNREQDAFDAYAGVAGVLPKHVSLTKYGFSGTVIGYDWPTNYASTINLNVLLKVYAHDLDQAKTNGSPSFSLFLDRLTNALSGKSIRVTVMAHSMGNFVVTRALMGNSSLASRITNLVSFAPDILQTDVEHPQTQPVIQNLMGQWYIYWAQADMILMTASNWANILLGTETYGQERLGQVGLRPNVTYSKKIVAVQTDEMLSEVGATSYDDTLNRWRSSMLVHCAYWRSPEFLQGVADNVT